MKLITAILRPSRLEAAKERLARAGIQGLTVTDVRGAGRQRGHTEIYRGHEYEVDLVPKVRLDVAVAEPQVEEVLTVLVEAGRSGPEGRIGDGKIFVVALEEAVRIRTGERGEVAL